jgi:hypothetical protein
LQNLALNYNVPSGWEIQNERITNLSLEGNSTYDYVDVRDDEVNVFFPLSSKPFVRKILLTATYAGKFYLPYTICHAMYDDDIKATTKGQWINVVPVSKKVIN